MNIKAAFISLSLAIPAFVLGCSGGSTTCDASGKCTSDGPLTSCAYKTAVEDDMIGVACEKDEDCGQGTCLLPGVGGNITNTVFGFCTRACNCNDDPLISVASEDATRSCVYPGGCYPDTGASQFRHLVLKCNSLSDCTDVDSRYTDCRETNVFTVVGLTCGHLRKVCQAGQ